MPFNYGGLNGLVSGGGLGQGNIFGTRVPPISPVSTPQAPTPTGPSLNSVYPNLGATNAGVSSALLSELRGELSPETLANLHNAAARFGVSSGMPGSGLETNADLLGNIRTTEQLQRQGLSDYSSVIPTVSQTQTVSPSQLAQLGTQTNLANLNASEQTNALNAEIRAMNAVNASAPDPTAAASYAQQLFDQYLQRNSGPAGGGGQPWWAGHGGQTYVIPGAAGGGEGAFNTGHWQ